MDLSKFLAEAKKSWGETVKKAGESNFVNPPDGSYVVQLSSAEAGESKGSGKMQVRMGFTILEGDQAGTTKYDYIQLEGARGLEPLAWRLQSLDIRPEDVDLEKLEEVLDALVDANVVMKITLKTQPNTDFQNVRVVKLLPNYQPEAAATTSAHAAPAPPAASNGGSVVPAPSSNGSEPDNEPESIELVVGMKVNFLAAGKSVTGVVKAIDEDAGTAVAQVGLKKHTVPFEELEVVAEGLDG